MLSINSLARVGALVLALVLISILTFVPSNQNDFWVQAAVGRIVTETGEIPKTVLFTYTWAKDQAFFPHEWLPSVVFYLLEEHLGHDRLVLVVGLVGWVLFALSFGLAWRVSRSFGVSLALASTAMLVANYRHFLRPELFALVLFLAYLHLLEHYRQTRRPWALLCCVPLAVVWANSHGSFVLGPIVALIFAAGEGLERARAAGSSTWRERASAVFNGGAAYAVTAMVMVIATMANPRGLDTYYYVWELSNSSVFKASIQEWHPTFSRLFIPTRGFRIFVVAVAVTALVVARRWRRLRATEGLLLLAFLAMASVSLRYVVWFGFVAMLVCARLAAGVPPRGEKALIAFVAGVSALGIGLALRFGNAHGAFPYHAGSEEFSEPMLEQLSRPEVQGNVLNSYTLGAELIYRAYPRLRPSIDSRADAYGEAYTLMHVGLLGDEKALTAFTDDFDVRYILVTWSDFEALKNMPSLRAAWEMQFADHKAVLLRRTKPLGETLSLSEQ
jgi:hypothetical protein